MRPNALLAVVFVTNEDDGSAPPAAKFFESNGDSTGTSAIGQYASYRQTRFAVQCGGMPIPYGMPVGPLADCTPMPNPTEDPSLAYDVQRYIDYFTRPAVQGGVKIDPKDVILVGLDGPETPFSTTLYDTSKGNTPYHDCATPALSSGCVEALQHSCENAVQPGFFADPAVRLDAVIRKASNSVIASICGDDLTKAPDFSATMTKVAELISSKINPGCLNAPVASRADGTPDCIVEDVTAFADGHNETVEVASCAENGNVPPCWQYNDLLAQYQMQGCLPLGQLSPPSCLLPNSCQPVLNPLDNTMQLASISVNRGGAMAPDGTTTTVECATIVSSSQ